MSGDNPKIFQVSEFNQFITSFLSELGEIIVEGEISEVNISQNKWVFITLKDDSSSLSVFGVMYQIANIRELEKGMLVKVRGYGQLHQKSGRFSLKAKEITPSGEGSLQQAFIKLQQRLQKEGLFEIERKRKIVTNPEILYLLTADNSKAYSDFVKVLNERIGGVKIYFRPISVQGENSVSSILAGFDYLETLKTKPDAVVLIRGGGSLEDLQSFNNEQVVRKIFSCSVAVVTGVGHESDWTLSDLVADLRASTPSNAAELLVSSRADLTNKINWQIDTLLKVIEHKLVLYHNFLDSINVRITGLANHYSQKLDNLTRLLKSLNYTNVLKRGYSITTNNKQKTLKSTTGLIPDEIIYTRLCFGKIKSKIIEIK